MNENAYEKAVREFEESGGIEKLNRMEKLANVLNETKFGNIKRISWSEEVSVKHEWFGLKEVKSMNDYIYGAKSLNDIKDDVLSDLSRQIKEITDSYGEVSQHGDFIINEYSKNHCLALMKLNIEVVNKS